MNNYCSYLFFFLIIITVPIVDSLRESVGRNGIGFGFLSVKWPQGNLGCMCPVSTENWEPMVLSLLSPPSLQILITSCVLRESKNRIQMTCIQFQIPSHIQNSDFCQDWCLHPVILLIVGIFRLEEGVFDNG